MTKIIIKKRRTLSLSKEPNPEPEEKKLSREELDKIEAEIKQQRYDDCKNWILGTWPEMFNKENVRPLALGVHRDIAMAHREAGGLDVLGFGATKPVKRFLSSWVKRKAYQKALAKPGSKRFSLTGEEGDLVDLKDREDAAKRIEAMKVKNKAKSPQGHQ
ncbi:ProQ/FINO family protein [Vibrio parahaemolyticus]|uniref:ProQ/FINO family protein n=1 Tax=Vibrio parahaemolyticus TaxID=670 RepID=UPI000A3B44B9|nr:ProQ/FINO family protein [Vibrio parahaemolyticus]MDF4628420.1 ProQ/FINO family protein [Vibrio parahaemolyticus]OUJ37937.1 hypothetical protein BTZ05_24445 [Vibrio parahaemolyticus]TOJ81535.1 hypothetical protein CGI32_19790 [Vibrio parahaemolyticus]